MGESLGSLYSYIVYMIAFICITILIMMVFDMYFFIGGLYAIQDGLMNDPGEDRNTYYAMLFGQQVSEFNPCPSGIASGGSNCSGVISYDEATGVIRYNMVYKGKFIDVGPAVKEEYVGF